MSKETDNVGRILEGRQLTLHHGRFNTNFTEGFLKTDNYFFPTKLKIDGKLPSPVKLVIKVMSPHSVNSLSRRSVEL